MTDWRDLAACRGMDANLFFPTRHENIDVPVAICGACPVQPDCLAYAMDNHECMGIWGGKSERARRRLRGTWQRWRVCPMCHCRFELKRGVEGGPLMVCSDSCRRRARSQYQASRRRSGGVPQGSVRAQDYPVTA